MRMGAFVWLLLVFGYSSFSYADNSDGECITYGVVAFITGHPSPGRIVSELPEIYGRIGGGVSIDAQLIKDVLHALSPATVKGIFEDILIMRRVFEGGRAPDQVIAEFMPEITLGPPGTKYNEYDILRVVHALPLLRRDQIFRKMNGASW